MKQVSIFSKTPVSAGTLWVWLPIAFMIITGVAEPNQADRILCDTQLPAEGAFVVLMATRAYAWCNAPFKNKR